MKKFALISVSDKTGIQALAAALIEKHNYQILSTGSTAKHLREAKLEVSEVSQHTQFPELLEGRLKTLHPKIHGGILCKPENPEHLEQIQAHNIDPIDLVIVNLYPFAKTIQNPNATAEAIIENIDIGGPTLLRAAAKNHARVSVICDPTDYATLRKTLEASSGIPIELREALAAKAFSHTANYDTLIAEHLSQQFKGSLGLLGPQTQSHPNAKSAKSAENTPKRPESLSFPESLTLKLERSNTLRYGENPHQKAALYGNFHQHFEQVRGKELSYNNLLDLSAAAQLIGEFEKPTIAILKHNNPCGVASELELQKAWKQALATDKDSPYGGIIVLNRTLENTLAEQIKERFFELILAPGFTPEALQTLQQRKKLRLISMREPLGVEALREIRSITGGLLMQDADIQSIKTNQFKTVTQRPPTQAEHAAMLFGWRVVKHVRSNAIVYAAPERTLGIGAGQMNRLDSARIATWKAAEAGLALQGSAICSDAFFPFADSITVAHKAGATAIIQPGGSIRDAEVIDAANEHDMTMIFTGTRHFKH